CLPHYPSSTVLLCPAPSSTLFPPLSLHDALPILLPAHPGKFVGLPRAGVFEGPAASFCDNVQIDFAKTGLKLPPVVGGFNGLVNVKKLHFVGQRHLFKSLLAQAHKFALRAGLSLLFASPLPAGRHALVAAVFFNAA